MPDVPEHTIEAEQDLDYTHSYDYDYGVLDDTLRVIARAVATTEANTLAVGEGAATSTATVTTTATTQAIGDGATTATADAQTTASTTVTTTGAVTSVATATTTATAQLSDATAVQPAVEWRVTRDGDHIEDAVFDVDPVVDTANPFGDYAVIKMDDSGGEKFEAYGRGTRVDVAVSENFGITFDNRFTGYVVERRETEQSGADVLEVEAYSFDQFLRRNTVTNNQRGNTITEALADIIQTDTPVTYTAANVEVGDDQELTRTYQGEAVETVLRDLAFKSNNEDFGVNDDLEFFFRERETTHIDRGIDNTEWFNYDIPELGKETVNEVEVWFDDGNESVIVDDGTDKLDLQDSLGLPDPGTQRAELNRPLITDINDAEDEGRKYLEFRNATLSGTVTTFGLFDAEPGDTIDIEIAPRGIDDEFVIAACEYRWGVDETILTIVEKRGDVDDILSELNESVQRVEMQDADRDAPKNRITTTDAGAVVSVNVDPTPDAVRFVNDGRRAVRDTWTGDPAPNIATLVVGDDGTGLSRSNDALRNQTNSASVTQTLPDATSVTFEATITQTGVREVGLETADGRLVARAVYLSPIDLDGTVTLTLAVSNDAAVSRGVLTNDGQTAVRDVLADNAPALPNAYAYGDSGTSVSETDSALGNELVEVSLEEVLIQNADTQADWETLIGDVAAGVPFTVDATGPRATKICWTQEGENYDSGQTGFDDTTNSEEYSGGDYWHGTRGPEAEDTPDFAEWTFTPNHTIPDADFGLQIRDAGPTTNTPEIEFRIIDPSGTSYLVDRLILDAELLESPGWTDIINNSYSGGLQNLPNEFTAGETYTFRVEVTDSDGLLSGKQYNVDVIAPYDQRYSADLTFDDANDGAGGFLDGPERFPALIERSLEAADTRRDVTEANFDLTANDVSNEFYVELANDGSTFTRINNSATGSVTFASGDRGVDVNIGFGRYSATTNQTPLNGNDPQQIDTWSLSADPDATVSDDVSSALTRAIVPPDTLTAGTTLREAGLKSGAQLLTRHELADFDVLTGQRIASAEGNRFTGEN